MVVGFMPDAGSIYWRISYCPAASAVLLVLATAVKNILVISNSIPKIGNIFKLGFD
jgi:hypothetical protein